MGYARYHSLTYPTLDSGLTQASLNRSVRTGGREQSGWCDVKLSTRSQAVARIAYYHVDITLSVIGHNSRDRLLLNCASPAVFEILGSKRIWVTHKFDLSGSREHLIPIGHFLLVVLWNQASISNDF